MQHVILDWILDPQIQSDNTGQLMKREYRLYIK